MITIYITGYVDNELMGQVNHPVKFKLRSTSDAIACIERFEAKGAAWRAAWITCSTKSQDGKITEHINEQVLRKHPAGGHEVYFDNLNHAAEWEQGLRGIMEFNDNKNH